MPDTGKMQPTTTEGARPSMATAFEACDGKKALVGIENLRVMITQEGDFWIAQGLEIDYFAQGDSLEAAKNSFADGLTASVKENLKLYGTMTKLLVVAPKEVWDEWYEEGKKWLVHDQISYHEIPRYTHVTFLKPAAAAA